MHSDKFWKYVWLVVGSGILLYIGSIVSFFYANVPNEAALAEAVGDSYDPSRDPFKKEKQESAPFTSDYLYRDSLNLGFEDWSWGVRINWRSARRYFEGHYALHGEFEASGGTIQAHTPPISLSSYQSISLVIYPENLEDVYFELYDLNGASLGKQPIGWYAPNGTLTQNAWNTVLIPLANLTSRETSYSSRQIISGFSLSAEGAGSAFIDDIRLRTSKSSHPPAPIDPS